MDFSHRHYALLTLLLLSVLRIGPDSYLGAQTALRILVLDRADGRAIPGAEIYVEELAALQRTDAIGRLTLTIEGGPSPVNATVFAPNYATRQVQIPPVDTVFAIRLLPLSQELDAVTVVATREANTATRRLRAVEGTAIYAGKKTEVVNVGALTVNLASNQARQLYSRVSGLNIYDSDDAGLQLSIGGRGLDPNRTASFNTRQNGYDISADVLGYPESYYSPPAEALREIQVVRGAASLQYGTQFGGLVNFIFHEPDRTRRMAVTSRNTVGSFGLYTNFTALSGASGKFGYYTYYNYKRGNGFRPNSGFNSHNAFVHIDYNPNEHSRISFEYTYLNYLARQAGGLTDAQFESDPLQSNRTRNWFDVDWRLYSLRYDNRISERTNLSANLFGLDARRGAVGFRTNRVSQIDDLTAPRDLIVNDFSNVGGEIRLLHRYNIRKRSAIALLGAKYYRAENSAFQGPGTAAADADFSLATDRFPSFPNQSRFTFPNRNLAFFAEHIFNLTDQLSVTPGARYDYIRTESAGSFRRIDFDLAGTPIRDNEFRDDRTFARNIVLLGVGLSYRRENGLELFANVSQNYRSVTFNDIRTVNPSFQVDADIRDESGYTADAGLRWRGGRVDVTANVFGLRYNDRLGEVLTPETVLRADGREVRTGRIIRRRGNIGSAFIYGLESVASYKVLSGKSDRGASYYLEAFGNVSVTDSRYKAAETAGVEGNRVEFIPRLNLKTGARGGWGNFLGSVQYAYLSDQFTDASNAPRDANDNQSGIVGTVPAYGVADLSLSYRWRWLTVETGVNNFLDAAYFTRRATGYPGPGIIPSAPRSGYLTVGVTL